ncbi:TatD family hydrolase [Desulfovibrio sp. OttesenSCG-928-G15]|nr:TatD family hydrolase [Desulfovibrio sp. OttesenSCG-928-G15]
MSKKKSQPFFPPPDLPLTGVESHAHLNSRQFAPDIDAVMQRATDAGVAQIIQVFLSPEAWAEGKGYFDAYPHVYFILGTHPTEAMNYSDTVENGIADAISSDKRIRGIGEIGLDYYWKDCPPEVQKQVFVRQLALARRLSLPAIIHCREAEGDTLSILEENGFKNYPVLWHCFGGNTGMAQRIIDNGWHISVPGPVTFPANQALREAVAAIPQERLLVETDCPYLSPAPLRGKRNEPANLGYTIAAMAEARGVSPEELWTQCGDNARRFFGIVASGAVSAQ